MAKLVKCKEHKEIFEIDDVHRDKSWIGNWETFVYLGYKIKEVGIIPFEELRDKYPVGPTMVVDTVTSIVEGTKPRDIFYPEENGNGHGTKILYKMLYVCPWYSKQSGFGGLDEIKEVGFNTYHTYSPFQWEQRGYWDTPAGKADCVRQTREICEALKERGMYGCFNTPHRDDNLRAFAEAMKGFDGFMACTGEEPDCSTPPSPSLKRQKELHDLIKEVDSNILVCASFNGGNFCRAMNPEAFDLIFPNSYPYTWNKPAMPGTPAAETGDFSLPWWEISEWLAGTKFPMMHKCVPKDMPMINIGQGFYNPRHHLPNVEEEWKVYNKEFGLNSFAVYPHGSGQGQDCICVMQDNRPDYGIKAQCRELMKKLK